MSNSMDRRVLLVSSHFPPDRSAGTHRVLRFANYLQDRGWPTWVLTIDPVAYRRSIPLDASLIQRVDPRVTICRTGASRGISALVGLRDRVTNHTASKHQSRTPDLGARRGWRARRQHLMGSLFAFPDDEIGWFGHAVWRGVRLVRRHRINVVLSSAPPFTCHLVGRAITALSGVPWVADFRDPWSRAPWGKHGSARAHRWLEAQVVLKADAVLLNTPELLDEFAAWYGSETAKKFYAVANGYDADVLERFSTSRPPDPPPLILTHAGSLYGNRDPIPLLQALASCVRARRIPRDAIRLNLIGKVAPQFDVDRAIVDLDLSRVVIRTSPVGHEESLKALAASHVLVVIQPGTALQVPAKLFEYVGLRRAILSLADEGGVARVTRDSGLGLVVPPTDVEAIATGIVDLYRRLTGPDRVQVNDSLVHRFDAQIQTARLGEIVSSLAPEPGVAVHPTLREHGGWNTE